MNESLSEWLALREAADWAARSERLVRRVTEVLSPVGTVRGLDLCTGTGSNIRYLIERLPRHQRWLVVDRDAALLEEVPTRLSTWAQARNCTVRTERHVSHIRSADLDCDVETREMNLTRLGAELFEGRTLVTASALLDLVSESWLQALADHCRAVGAVALFSITYDGRSSCDPVEPEDDMVRELMNRHQRTDKGLGGPAAGPEGSAVAERVFEAAGYQVERAASDWSLGPSEQEFQRQLIEGWAHAASEVAPDQSKMIADWLTRRLAQVESGRSRIVVNHVDMMAWLSR